MTTIAPEGVRRRETTVRPRRIAVVPVYNEDATLVAVLEDLEPLVDEIVIVDDGSTDGSRALILGWAQPRAHVQTVLLNRNQGLSAAYHAAFTAIAGRVGAGELGPDDAIITVDADGQHQPQDLDRLLARLYEGPCEAVVARRDLSGYSWFKRVGNWLLSLWASLWAGCWLYDVESGFRVFRAWPLIEALQYYSGYRYSETVEVAVVLARLGYRISNDVLVPVPVSRSRTRLRDGVIDALAMVGAWWRTVAGRRRPSGLPRWAVYALPALPMAGLAFITTDLLVNPLFLASDSLHHYAHVWYLSDQIFHHARFPLHMSLLDGGRAMMFPYAIGPYLLGAVVFPLLGNWTVTLMMAGVVLATIYTAGVARPVMRDPWLILLFLLNPFFIDAVFGFQFASLWSTLFFYLFVLSFERRRYWLAGVLAWLTASSHPIMGTTALGVYSLCVASFDRPKLRPLMALGLPVAIALIPIYWMTLSTPAAGEISTSTITLSIIDSVVRRGTVFAAPFVAAVAAPQIRRFYPAVLAVVVVVFSAGMVLQSGVVRYPGAPSGYYGIVHRSSDVYAQFFGSPSFQPGATYRVLEPGEREDGMYRFIRHGAVLSNEFFTESLYHRSFSEPEYQCYAAYKKIDYVVIERAYEKRLGTSERDLLDSLVSAGRAKLTYTDAMGRFRVYDVRAFRAEKPGPPSFKECGLL